MLEPLGGLIKSDFWAPCLEFLIQQLWDQGFFGGSAVKNPPGSAGDMGSTPGSGRSLGGEMATHSSTLAWRIPWKEEPGGVTVLGGAQIWT